MKAKIYKSDETAFMNAIAEVIDNFDLFYDEKVITYLENAINAIKFRQEKAKKNPNHYKDYAAIQECRKQALLEAVDG
jgi:hypothetical protein